MFTFLNFLHLLVTKKRYATYLGGRYFWGALLSGGRYNLVPRVSLLPALSSLQGVGRRETLGTRLGVATFRGRYLFGGVATFEGKGSLFSYKLIV